MQSKACWVVPLMRNPQFVSRSSQLSELEAKLFVDSYCPRVAIVGLGGVGKTQIALELAYQTRHKRPDCSIFWVAATSAENVQQAYLDIGRHLNIQGIDNKKADVKCLVQSYLSSENAGRWLLILDNADESDMWLKTIESGTRSTRLIDYLPTSSKGSIILTTRNRKVAVELTRDLVMELPHMDEKVGIQILKKSLHNQALLNDREPMMLLMTQLTFLPLAIVQAAAYINKNDISIFEYLSLWDDTEEIIIEVLSENFEDEGRYQTLKNPVATTWLISFDQIQRCDPLAAEYLSFMSCIDPKMIPLSLLPPAQPKKRMLDAIGTLTAYSFITRQSGEQSFDVHRLVHLATRNWLKKRNSIVEWTWKTMERLVKVFPSNDHQNRSLWRTYLPHTRFILASQFISKDAKERIVLLEISGLCLQSDGRYAEAREQFLQVAEIRENALGKLHPETLKSLNYLVLVLRYQGRYKEAKDTGRRVLDGREKVLGKEHPDTLVSIDNLASVLQYQGKYEEAEVLHRRALDRKEKTLGKEHQGTLTSVSNLAEVLWYQGKYGDAEILHRQALEGKQNVLGKEHPETLMSVTNLAWMLQYQAKYEEAEAMSRQALNGKKAVLGKDHPETLTSVHNLSRILLCQCKYEEAEALSRQALNGREKLVGKDHPSTLRSLSNFAEVLRYQGKLEDAGALHRQALNEKELVLGKEHPDTLASVNSLALVLQHQGKYEEAEALYRRSLDGKEKVLGQGHPETLASVYGLAGLFLSQGQHNPAAELYDRACTGYKNVFGPGHPATIAYEERRMSLLREMCI
ncbi:P-loop containing nucleoside triphosphate hydrolase protein [Bisporella sp. PMI_857]|nr:P-loop containing nucleoside triphosphate hydrolase protein [Bisporella sp. PMI_857]